MNESQTTLLTRPADERVIAQMFDRISRRYDFLNRLLSARQDVRWRRKMVGLIPHRTGGTLVDMATGTGDVILEAYGRRKEYAQFIGGDISEGMMAFAKLKAKEQGIPENKIQWQTMSAEHLTLADQSADCITIAFGLRNVVNKDQAIHEFSRVLKPAGALLILEFFIPMQGVLAQLFQFYFHRILPLIGRLFSEREAYEYLPRSVASFYSASELRLKLKSEGFVVTDEVNFLFGACRLMKAVRSK